MCLLLRGPEMAPTKELQLGQGGVAGLRCLRHLFGALVVCGGVSHGRAPAKVADPLLSDLGGLTEHHECGAFAIQHALWN